MFHSVVGLCFVPMLLVTIAMFMYVLRKQAFFLAITHIPMMNTVLATDLEEHSGVAHKVIVVCLLRRLVTSVAHSVDPFYSRAFDS